MAKAFSGKKPQHFGNTIRVFLNYLGRHKFMLGLVGVLTAVSALANLLGTYMIKPVVNGILETGSIPGLVRGVALTAAIYAVGALSTLGYTQTMVRAAQKVLHDIRRDLFAHLQTLPLSFFDSRRNGELMSLFTNDVDTISDALNNSFALLIQSFIQVVGTLVLLFVLNWRLSLLVVVGYAVCSGTSGSAPTAAVSSTPASSRLLAIWKAMWRRWPPGKRWSRCSTMSRPTWKVFRH